MPPEARLHRATPSANNMIDRRVWLSKVEILDPSVDDKSATENTLTVNILKYLQEGRYFKEANFFPDKVDESDLVLRFQFDRYKQKRTVHPAYFPGALLTATLYIWVGGPVTTESLSFSGKLIVEDSHGSLITEVSSQVNDKYNLSIYSNEKSATWSGRAINPRATDARTLIIKELLNKAIEILQKGK